MRKKALLTALVCTIIFTGCKNQQHCEAYSQCDEVYSDYNCTVKPRFLTTPQYPAYYLRPTTFYPYPVTNYNTNNYYNCSEQQQNVVVTPRPTLDRQATQVRPQRKPTQNQPQTRRSRQ